MSATIVASVGDPDWGASQKALVTKLDNAVQLLADKQNEFADYLKELADREKEIARLKDLLYEQMSEEEVEKITTDRLNISRVAPSERSSIDSKTMMVENPALYKEIFAKYPKVTQVKGYVRITPRKGDK